MQVVDATCKTKWLKGRVCIKDDIPKFVIVYLLGNLSCCYIDYQSWATEMVADYPVCNTAFYHVIWNIYFCAINKSCNHIPCTIQFGNWSELVFVQEALHQYAVYLFPNPSILPSITYSISVPSGNEEDTRLPKTS